MSGFHPGGIDESAGARTVGIAMRDVVLGVHGSITLTQSLLRGLIDVVSLVVLPTAAGKGRRLFEGDGELRRFTLERSVTSPSGALLLDYRSSAA